MAAMQQQMASMPPEMMQQAMQMAQNATPEQIAQMRAAASSMPPETLAAQASQAASMYGGQGAGAQQRQQLEAATQLKAEGNRLHGAKAWREAAQKYERAVNTLAGQYARRVHVGGRSEQDGWLALVGNEQTPLPGATTSCANQQQLGAAAALMLTAPAQPASCLPPRPHQPRGPRPAHQLPEQPGQLRAAAGGVGAVRRAVRHRAGGRRKQPQGAVPQG